jgi:threonine dehydratase
VFEAVCRAQRNLKGVAEQTPLQRNANLSEQYNANVYLKREDIQPVRSYKLRGAYNKISSLSTEEKHAGVVCASAGNHAQGVAYSCRLLGLHATIFMPVTTPEQKVKKVKQFGKDKINVVLTGDGFDDAYESALQFSLANSCVFVHPFDDEKVIAGQGTVALEIVEDAKRRIDYLFVPVGGGGLAAGVCTVFKRLSPQTKIIGVEPAGAPSMKKAFESGFNLALPSIDTFVDGAAVRKVGAHTFALCRDALHDVVLVPEGKVCTTILRLYNEEALVVEPAGALSIAALDFYKEKIVGKNVVCIVSGSNNDILRTEEIKERSLLYEGLKHYFVVQFPQRPGALKEFVGQVLGPHDDITYFQYAQKNNRERGPAVIGLELKNREDLPGLILRLENRKFSFTYLNDRPELFTQLVG